MTLQNNHKRKSVCIIDDEPLIRQFIRTVLHQSGYLVVEAADGAQALSIIRSIQVAVVITDMVMPNRSGIEIIPMIRSRYPEIKILAISGVITSNTFLNVASGLGAHDVLQKPFSAETLRKSMASLMADVLPDEIGENEHNLDAVPHESAV